MIIDEYAMEYVLITWIAKFLPRLDWMLSRNPNAISLLENNLDKVDWWMLSKIQMLFQGENKFIKVIGSFYQ
jgi:hypothetical protein